MFKTITWNTALAAERWRFNLKLNKKRRPRPKASSCKLQAASLKPQAASFKLQAASGKLHDSRTLIKFHASGIEVLDHDETILWM